MFQRKRFREQCKGAGVKMAKDCRSCKTYKDCIGKEFYTYADLRFCPFQVLWILENAEKLRAGNWPPNPEGSSYIDSKIRTGYGSEAYYTKPVGILAEVEYRLKRTGTDGKLLRAEVENGKDINMMEPESRSALMYIKGWRRKRMGYSNWKKWDKLYQKVK